MLVIYIGMFEKARNYERYDYDMIEVLGNSGGITDALLIIGSYVVFYFMDIHQTIQVFDVFSDVIIKPGN